MNLKLNIAAILNQSVVPEWLIIVDNGSTDGTSEFVKREYKTLTSLIYLHQENEGCAGGMARGIEEAILLGADWFWLMDDDASPAHDALERLIACPAFAHERTGILQCLARTTNGELGILMEPMEPQFWLNTCASHKCIRIRTSSFVGMMVSKMAIFEVGLPLRSFFLWVDDSEFSRRVSYSFNCFGVLDSIIIHPNIPPGTVNAKEILSEDSVKFWCLFRNNMAAAMLGVGSHFKCFIRGCKSAWFYRKHIQSFTGFVKVIGAMVEGFIVSRYLSDFKLPIRQCPKERLPALLPTPVLNLRSRS